MNVKQTEVKTGRIERDLESERHKESDREGGDERDTDRERERERGDEDLLCYRDIYRKIKMIAIF